MWENRETFNGLSVLPYFGGSYVQSPYEDCTKEQFEEMVKYLHQVDLSKIVEFEDNTDLKENLACSGASCEIV
jgi:ribonucleoside-triphosphate reductase